MIHVLGEAILMSTCNMGCFLRNKQNYPLKGTATLIISMFYQKELYKPSILIQVSSESVEK